MISPKRLASDEHEFRHEQLIVIDALPLEPTYMYRLVLLTAVSGAGKSYGLKYLDRDCVTFVELDHMIKRLYATLNLGGPNESDPYSYDKWRPFLEGHLDDREVLDAFFDCFVELRSQPNDVVIAGNHFQISAMTMMIDRSVSPCFDQVQKFFLDVPAITVYQQRQNRGNPWDIKVTPEKVAAEIGEMQQSVMKQGFVTVTADSMVPEIKSFFGCE